MLLILSLLACGYSSVDNEVTGQLKKVVHNTPILCPEYTDVDLSLGVIRDGVGSMSDQDIWMVVPPDLKDDVAEFVASGEIVNIKYDVYRVTFCTNERYMRSIEVAP